jgi:DNA-binding PucR family transcriptional regulator
VRSENFLTTRQFCRVIEYVTQKSRKVLRQSVAANSESILTLIPLLVLITIGFQLIAVNYSTFNLSVNQQTNLNRAALYQNESHEAMNEVKLIGGGRILIQQRNSSTPIYQRFVLKILTSSTTFVFDEKS